MVDFDNDTTITTPAADVTRIIILQRRYDTIESLEAYLKQKYSGAKPDTHIIRARAHTLYIEILDMLIRILGKEEAERIEELITTEYDLIEDQERALFTATRMIYKALDHIRLTRIDLKKDIDTTRVILEDEEKGI
jgi:hypothetical protein